MSRRVPEEIDPFDPTEFLDAAPTPMDELGPGALVGDYRIEGKIGEGGMGVVFAAVHPVIGKRAAIKVLKRELCTDRTELSRFIDEARAVNQIGHPNIVDIFTLGQLRDGRSYLVMEWLAGETLRTRLGRSRPDLDETCYVLRSLARALDAAHEKGIVHRDLKPDNVFLVAVRGDRPLIKLLDFGIAKLLHAEHRIDRTATNQMIGTPLYIAPEQARAEAIDHRADIYALGAMAFEMIAGTPPFGGNSAMEVIAKHMLEPAPRLSTHVQGVPADIVNLVDAMLDKLPANRPSLADLVTILDRLAPAVRAVELHGLAPAQARVTAYTMSPNTPSYALAATPAPSSTPMTLPATSQSPVMTAAPPPALAVTSPGSRSSRRWLMPVVGGVACMAALVVALVLVRGGGEPAAAETATPTAVQPDPTPEPQTPANLETPPTVTTEPPRTETTDAEPKAKPVQADPSQPVAGEPPPKALHNNSAPKANAATTKDAGTRRPRLRRKINQPQEEQEEEELLLEPGSTGPRGRR